MRSYLTPRGNDPRPRSLQEPTWDALRQGQDEYINLSDEASAEDFRREDFDPEPMARADAYARHHGLPLFDEVADVDNALRLVAEVQEAEAHR